MRLIILLQKCDRWEITSGICPRVLFGGLARLGRDSPTDGVYSITFVLQRCGKELDSGLDLLCGYGAKGHNDCQKQKFLHNPKG